MNTAVYSLNAQEEAIAHDLVFTLPSLGYLVLLAAILLSAFAVVYAKDYKRQLSNELEGLQQARESLQVEASQLLLEEHTWAAPARVEAVAVQQMAMESPAVQNIVMVNA